MYTNKLGKKKKKTRKGEALFLISCCRTAINQPKTVKKEAPTLPSKV